jgi:hypothetical protein
MKQHVNLPYLRASVRSGNHGRDSGVRETVLSREKKTSLRVATMAEKAEANGHKTHLISIPASQRDHT